jgi:arylsulfatase B
MPTLLELCGVDPGDHTFHGKSLVPLLKGEAVAWNDRVLVTDSQRVADPIKWRKSAAMSGSWRLINGEELYDLRDDPGQRRDISAHHPGIVAYLRQGYERWWEEVSKQFNGTIPITVGQDVGEVVRLNTHDWRNDPVACAWNQSLVRAGMAANGYWEVDVAAPGRYRFELRRWPREEARAMTEGIPGPLKPFTAVIKDGWGGGRALALSRAALRVGDLTFDQDIGAGDAWTAFEVELSAGETQVQSYLTDEEGSAIGAYYVYVERLP